MEKVGRGKAGCARSCRLCAVRSGWYLYRPIESVTVKVCMSNWSLWRERQERRCLWYCSLLFTLQGGAVVKECPPCVCEKCVRLI